MTSYLNNKYYNTYVALYNESVRLDNIDYRNGGKAVNQERAHKLARTWASINLKTKNQIESFMGGWHEFYYHMFD